jgi:hypothetical protein
VPLRHAIHRRGVTAINEGCVVLGFGFMDKEELGQKLIEAFAKKHGRA